MFIVRQKKGNNFYKIKNFNFNLNLKRLIRKIENLQFNNKVKYKDYLIIKIKAQMK